MGKAYQIQYPHNPYFLTFQVVGWADIFTRAVYKNIVVDCMNYCIENKGLIVYAYVIMSNHIHVIWQAPDSFLSNIVRDFKRETAKRILNEVKTNTKESRREWLLMIFKYHARKNKRSRELQLWTHENRAIHLNTRLKTKQRLDYIHNNPIRAGLVFEAHEYVHSSAVNYAGFPGLVEVEKV